ncbi:MAG: pirin family protein [Peptococcaceae bacterium]|nr:pirin family protein [Peptococcaceae bacterium]
MNREVETQVQGFWTKDGAGVKLVRVLGNSTVRAFDPFLMLDSFDSDNPADYRAGFPMHPHRGIETVSYVARGKMRHRDSMGFSDTVADGEVQWMTAGAGILHEEMIPDADRLLGVQLWLNLPRADKRCAPSYHHISRAEIPEVAADGSTVRVLAGRYGEATGHQGDYLPLNYYHIHLDAGAALTFDTDPAHTAMIFTLEGAVQAGQTPVAEKTAAKLSAGDALTLAATDGPAEVLFMSAPPLGEPIAWGGPIVMNTEDELREAYFEMEDGTFLEKSRASVEQ